MAKRYVTDDGDYLDVSDNGAYYVIAWFCADETGTIVGEDRPRTTEARVLHDALVEFCKANPDSAYLPGQVDSAFTFDTELVASKALRVANAALIAWRDGVKLPAWAKKATAEGWKPPKGWRPKA